MENTRAGRGGAGDGSGVFGDFQAVPGSEPGSTWDNMVHILITLILPDALGESPFTSFLW